MTSGGSKDGTISAGPKKHIETIYKSGGYYGTRFKDEVLEASTDGKGNLTFDYATPSKFEKASKTSKRSYVEFDIQAGAVNGDTFNINWGKVNSISGQTYNLRQAAKEAGLKWDAKEKKWKRK